MWQTLLIISAICPVLSVALPVVINMGLRGKRKIGIFLCLFAGVFAASFFAFLPMYLSEAQGTDFAETRSFFLSLLSTMQVFTIGFEYDIVKSGASLCPENLQMVFMTWMAILFALAPFLTFGFVLSLFKNLKAKVRYLFAFFKDVHVFSELNEKSILLARDIKTSKRKVTIIFNSVSEDKPEITDGLIEEAAKLDAICFKRDVLSVKYRVHAPFKGIWFYLIDTAESDNLENAVTLIENYADRDNTHLFVFTTKASSELLLRPLDKGKMKVRRINERRCVVNHLLYTQGNVLFESAGAGEGDTKHISAVVVGMGGYGTTIVKALTWYGQMDGYSLEINAFDQDPLAEEKFIAQAPELMNDRYNGVVKDGEAQYAIRIQSGMDVDTASFVAAIKAIKNATFVVVSLGDDDRNIRTAVNLRVYFEQMKIHPVIYAIVHNFRRDQLNREIGNARGQKYDICFVGDMESIYTEEVMTESELEKKALERHLKYGKESVFWEHEYNYRSSMASAIHMEARIACKIPGADKAETELTEDERDGIEKLEHRRWNAYMRSEGFIHDPKRNDLGKMHNDLVVFDDLSEEEKRKDSRIGTK